MCIKTQAKQQGWRGNVPMELQGEGMGFFPTFKWWTQIQEEGKKIPPLQLNLSPYF